MKKANTFLHSSKGKSEGKKGAFNKFYTSPGSGGQGKVGGKRNKFMKNGPNSTETCGG